MFSWNKEWKELLVASDTSISFLTGELLFNLCKGNIKRLIRHVGFESAAGYLYSKGILKDGVVDEGSQGLAVNEESSDEEYFKANPPQPANHTPLVPETEEDAQELEYLMDKITEYNSKSK